MVSNSPFQFLNFLACFFLTYLFFSILHWTERCSLDRMLLLSVVLLRPRLQNCVLLNIVICDDSSFSERKGSVRKDSALRNKGPDC